MNDVQPINVVLALLAIYAVLITRSAFNLAHTLNSIKRRLYTPLGKLP